MQVGKWTRFFSINCFENKVHFNLKVLLYEYINLKLKSMSLEALNLIHSEAESYQSKKLVSITKKNQQLGYNKIFFCHKYVDF